MMEPRVVRRSLVLPDLNVEFDPEQLLPGTPNHRLEACLEHARKHLALAKIRKAQKKAWLGGW